MAVLATPDWHFNTRDGTMDIPTNSRQPTSPTNDSGSLQHHGQQQQQQSQHQTQQQQQQQQQFQQQQHLLQQQQMLLAAQQSAFTYPVQQQPHGSWTPNITAAPFYPSFFQNPQQQQQQQQPPQPYPAQIPPQNPYFDSTNALAAQWAYQQMMFNAQHVFPQMQPQHHSSTHRPSNPHQQGQPPNSNDFFTQNSLLNPFPSGTPPPHPHRSVSGDQTQQYPGFHPYRRPNRQQPQPHSSSDSASDRRQGINHIPHPPYARPDASGSTSSVSSSSSRKRTNSNQSVQSNGHSNRRPSPVSAGGGQSSTRSSPSSAGGGPALSPSTQPAAPSPLRQQPHHRNSSTSSTSTATSIRPGTLSPSPPTSSISTTSAIASTTTASSSGSATPRLTRPSPLSQGTFTASEKRMSRDDIDLGALQDAAQNASSRSGGLKGRLRRALSFNPAQVLKEEGPVDDNDDVSIKASQLNNKMKDKPTTSNASSSKANGLENGSANAIDSGVEDGSSTRAPTQVKKKSRAASLFNARMNMSTDNISLSSTVSSASVMIRKLGAMGKLARRNSLAGITSLFKDKDKDGQKDKKGKKKEKKASPKAEASEASVSHVTAELDRMGGDWTVSSAELQGLTPAAKLARQHTLKSNAEAAAKAKEAAAAAVARASASTAVASELSGANKEVIDGNVVGNGSVVGVATWDRNTATRQGSVSPVRGALVNMRVNEDGTRTLIEEDDDDESDEGHYGHPGGSFSGVQHGSDGWDDDDEDWDVDGDGDEDVTIRADARDSVEDGEYHHGFGRPSAEMEPWAVDIRRSIEKKKTPARSILRNATSYDQNQYLQHDHVTILNRGRSNSYTSTIANSEVGPLARMPSPDPDHIDGLRHNTAPRTSSSSSSTETTKFTLPPLSFESSPSPLNATFNLTTPKDLPKPPSNSSSISSPIITHTSSTHSEHRTSAIYQNPTFNLSAPALSTIGSSSTKSPPTLTHRSQTAPPKRLTFANNLSVYDTFSSNVYDRRSEPATWSRLTPVLAQRIKEELNSYKMEEMEVHAASRIHTQFFV